MPCSWLHHAIAADVAFHLALERHRIPDRYCSKPSRKMASSLMIVPVALPAAVAWYCVFRNTDTEPAE